MRRLAVVVLGPARWAPPGIDPQVWRAALADDLLSVLATLADVEAAVAVDPASADLAAHVGWPGLPTLAVPTLDLPTLFAAVTQGEYGQAVLLAGDAPDLPGLGIAKLLRPLTSRPVAVAPALPGPSVPVPSVPVNSQSVPVNSQSVPSVSPVAVPGSTSAGPAIPGLLGVAARLPAPSWLPWASLDELTVESLRKHAPQPNEVAVAPGWHRLRLAEDLTLLDPRLEGWDATRALLSPRKTGYPDR